MCLVLGTVRSAFLYAQCVPYFVRKVGITIIILTFFVSVPRPVPVPCTPILCPPSPCPTVPVRWCLCPPCTLSPVLVPPHFSCNTSLMQQSILQNRLKDKRFVLPPWQERPGSEEEAADHIAAAGRKQREMKAPAQGPLSPLYLVQDPNL